MRSKNRRGSKTHQVNANKNEKLEYRSPRLTKYGSLKDLTKAVSGLGGDATGLLTS